MSASTMSGTTGSGLNFNSDDVRDYFVTGLRNAHAVEKQAISLIERQLDRVENYPDVASMLQRHLQETQQQHQRLDQILDQLGESRSMLKDMAMEFGANMQALAHGTADDEILKNTFANLAFENFEIASYKSLICMAEAGGFQQFVSPLQQSLREEQAMASWIDQNVETVTRAFLQRAVSGRKADR
jgi:ferritin-like metal-binding protein YciE